MKLTDEQVNRIREDIDRSGITWQSLKDDLLDHFCCFTEEEMKRGSSFEDAYQKASEQIAPNGLAEIQSETIFLLNAKKIMMMKMITYIVGALCTMALSFSILMKIQHWPGAADMHLIALGGLIGLFLPLLVATHYRNFYSKVISEKLRVILGLSSLMVEGAGILLKANHMEIGATLMLIGFLIFTFGFVPALFFRMYKRSVQ